MRIKNAFQVTKVTWILSSVRCSSQCKDINFRQILLLLQSFVNQYQRNQPNAFCNLFSSALANMVCGSLDKCVESKFVLLSFWNLHLFKTLEMEKMEFGGRLDKLKQHHKSITELIATWLIVLARLIWQMVFFTAALHNWSMSYFI